MILKLRKYKIKISPESAEINTLQSGDIVNRQYLDGKNPIYSLMYVENTGVDMVADKDGVKKEAPYFIGQLLFGDEPKTGELLNFVRVTSLSNSARGGALYLTSNDSNSPYLDVINVVDKNSAVFSLNGLGSFDIPDTKTTHIQNSDEYVTEVTSSWGEAGMEFPLLNNSPHGNIVKDPVLIGFMSIKPSKDTVMEVFGTKFNLKGDEFNDILMPIDSSDMIGSDLSLNIHLPSIGEVGDYFSIRNLIFVPMSAMTGFDNGTKTRIGQLSGIVDEYFGALDSYGAYFQKIYATKDVNIAGTLTAGSKDGQQAIFYVGKIRTNAFMNSMSIRMKDNSADIYDSKTNPVGIGNVYKSKKDSSFYANNDLIWHSVNSGALVCFSMFIMPTLDEDNYVNISAGGIDTSVNVTPNIWNRVYFYFSLPEDSKETIITLRNADVLFCAPQLELGVSPSIYQPTDEVSLLDYNDKPADYGMWATKGGFGGTIQNPIVKLNDEGVFIGDAIQATRDGVKINLKKTGIDDAINKRSEETETRFEITEGQINGKLQETAQILNSAKTLSGETKQTLESTTARVNEFNITAKKFEGTLGEITKKQGEVEGSILAVQATAKGLEASVTGFKETEKEIKDTATRIEATHQGIVLEASEKSAQKAIDGLEIGGRNLIIFRTLTPTYINTDGSSPASGEVDATDFIQVIPEESYIYTNNLPVPNSMYIGFYDINKDFTRRIAVPISERQEYYFKPIENEYYVRISNSALRRREESQLEKGNKPTDWTPAPEDYDAKFTETHASLKVLNDRIASEVSKTNGIRTDLTTLSQSHDSFKLKVVEDVANAIDSNNEVIKSSFEMKDNILTAYGKEFNILAELKVGNETILTEDGKIRTKLIKTDELVSKKVKTANSGPRFEMEGSEMKVYGDGVYPNMIFGVNEVGYAVMEYYTQAGDKLYDLGPSGISILDFAPAKWTEKKLKQFSTGKSRENIIPQDFSKIVFGDVTQTNSPIYYNYYAGGNPTASQKEREREKYTYASINGSKIPDGWYYTPPEVNNRGYKQYLSNNSGKFIKPEAWGLYSDSFGVLDRDNIYIVECHLYIGGISTDYANYYFQYSRDTIPQDLGLWYEGLKAVNGDDAPYLQSDVWHNGCKWRCVKDTTSEPTIYNTDWVLLTGDTELTLTLLSSCNFTYQKDNINDNIRAVVKMGLVDVTPQIKAQDWSWTRSTSNKLSDEVWNENNKHIQSEFKLRAVDLDGVDFSYPVMFTCTAFYRTDNKIIKTFNTLEL